VTLASERAVAPRLAGALLPATFFALVFVATLIVSLIIREILLPYVLPQLHAGNGFFVGGDSVGFHDQAVALSQAVREGGWRNWMLSPEEARTPLVGLAAAIYALLGPSPLFLIPFNALIHALSALLLFLIMRELFRNDWAALAAAAPFVLMPTAAYWYSQLHKDGIFILGAYAFLAGWVALGTSRELSPPRLLGVAALLGCGMFLMWFVRDYTPTIMLGLSGLLAVVCLVQFGVALAKGRMGTGDAAVRMLVMALLFAGLYGFVSHGPTRNFMHEVGEPTTIKPRPNERVLSHSDVELQGPDLPLQSPNFPLQSKDYCAGWQRTAGVPSAVDLKVSSLVRVRTGFFQSVYADAGSTIDRHYCIVDIGGFLLYLPRAIQVGFLAPFPYQWLEHGAIGGSTMRRIAGLEMLLVYTGLALAVCAFVTLRERALLTILLFAGPVIVLYGIVTPNVGALHRMRYGFLMLFVGLGAGWLVKCWLEWRAKAVRAAAHSPVHV
jgi:hypothetical protein